ncbi:4-hydroxyphenylacetate 3-monooxygenase [Scopulibacillus darangshiensis]|uniref:4-hydroxyphenylacetate 3-monooxygenase n=1 Tax=Scopulibacillus darangshiensis TaxID=442528 RepID=A0A4R2NY95_9BACL|nr:4-hydroxyphenylacetate 3-monooxygenase, oxygenase component [Scopulibacillus darangshiensis]TCP27057.1 4-hydroxyphenylacetate 3-monooxygenase [Scopulibacillus darangshiensis]
MPVADGKQYINRMDQLKANIWYEGQKVTGKLSAHPAFKGVIHSQAKLYDLQYRSDLKDVMTWTAGASGKRFGTSYLTPKSREDLEKRRQAIQEWAKLSHGMLGRTPDYMNTALMTFASSAAILKGQSEACADNMRKYFEFVRENDLALTHTFIKPQVNRSSSYEESDPKIIDAQIIDKNDDGIVIHGARLLATQGGTTDEIMVFPSGAQLPQLIGSEPHAFAFAIPNNTPGLKFYCRESFDYGKSRFDHPLGSQFEEMDTIVVFDHVTVPWGRVFLHGDIFVNNRLYKDSGFFPHVTHQVICKNIIKTEFILGLIQKMIDEINIGEYQHIHDKVSEVIISLETLKGFIYSSEAQADVNEWGVYTPAIEPLLAASQYYPKVYPRYVEIIQLIGASGLVTIPTEADFKSERKEDIDHFLQSAKSQGEDKVRLYRLAWDASMSAFGSRQVLYERFFFGDPVRLATSLYCQYKKQPYVDRVTAFLADLQKEE